MKAWMVFLFGGLMSSAVAGAAEECPLAFPNAGLCASYEWTSVPATDREGKLRLRFWDRAHGSASGPYVDPVARPGVELFMDMGGGHGHGSSPTRFTREDAGVYEFYRLFFVMRGEWQIRFQVLDGQGRVSEQVVERYSVPH